jgi:hypothetical protein
MVHSNGYLLNIRLAVKIRDGLAYLTVASATKENVLRRWHLADDVEA